MAKQLAGWALLWHTIENNELPRLDTGTSPFALAKCAYLQRCKDEGWDEWLDTSVTFYKACAHMITFIRSNFLGGEQWASRSDIGLWPEAEGYYLHQTLDQTDKFGKAARYLMGFIYRGQPKLVYKRRSTINWVQAPLEGGEE